MYTAPDVFQLDLEAVFKALASTHRREIIRMLSDAEHDSAKSCCGPGEVCACKNSDRLGLSPSTTSHHMSVLRDAGLVSARKQGTWTYYTLRRDRLATLAEEIKRL